MIDRLLVMSFQDRMFDQPQDEEFVPYLSAYIRQHPKQQGELVTVTRQNWRELADFTKSSTVSAKLEKLLALVGKRTCFVGEHVLLDADNDYPLVDLGLTGEFDYLVEYLKDAGLVESDDQVEQSRFLVRLTPKGWERLQPSIAGKGIPGRCFVAMSFAQEMLEVYDDGIEKAVTECGLVPRMLARIHHNDDINDRILAELRDAELVVAEFTKQRGGVYFEAGFAKALGREVIWCCRKDEEQVVHFDTRQFNFIFWSTTEDLKEKLIDRIKGTGFARK